MAARSVRQVQDLMAGGEVSERRREGTEMRAELVLRIVRERVLARLVKGSLSSARACLLPLYGRRNRRECLRSCREIRLHALECIDCGSFDDIEHSIA